MGRRGSRQAAFGVGPTWSAQIRVQGSPEPTLPEVRWRWSSGARPRADAAGGTRELAPDKRRGVVGQQHSRRARVSIARAAAIRCPWNGVFAVPRPPPGTWRCTAIPLAGRRPRFRPDSQASKIAVSPACSPHAPASYTGADSELLYSARGPTLRNPAERGVLTVT